MSTAAPPDLAALRRASRFAGLVTLAGAVIVLGSIGYSVWRLADTEGEKARLEKSVSALRDQEQALSDRVKRVAAEKEALEKEVKSIAATIPPREKGQPKPPPIQQIKDAVAERAELERQVAVLRKEAALIRNELKRAFADPKKNLQLWSKPEYRGVMTAVLVSPTSRYAEMKKAKSPTGKWYTFTLSLAFPDDAKLAAAMKRDIRSVTYEMNHPYRKVAPLMSKNAGNNFAVSYAGAGTLRNVVVKIDVSGAGVVALDYDMTRAHPEAAKK